MKSIQKHEKILKRISRSNTFDELYAIMKHLIRNRKYCTNSNKLFSGQLLSSPWNNILGEHSLTFIYSINIATMYWNEIIKKQMIEKFIYLNHFNPHIYSTGGTSTTCHFGAHELFPLIEITCCSICSFPYTSLLTIACICLFFSLFQSSHGHYIN